MAHSGTSTRPARGFGSPASGCTRQIKTIRPNFDELVVFLGAPLFPERRRGMNTAQSPRRLGSNTQNSRTRQRGVSPGVVEFYMDRSPAFGCRDGGDPRPARQPADHRRLPLRRHTRRGDDHRCRRAAVPAGAGRQAGHRAADQHVFLRAERSARRRRFPPPGARQRGPGAVDRRRAADLAAPGQLRSGCGSATTAMSTPAASAWSSGRGTSTSTQDLEARYEWGGAAVAVVRNRSTAGSPRRGATDRDPDEFGDQRQHRGVLAAGTAGGAGGPS